MRRHVPLLFLNVFVVAACGLVYELLAGTVASYVLGDSVTQFSLVIGVYLAALGAGAWLSRFLEGDLVRRFVEIELAVAVVGGLSAPLLFLTFARSSSFRIFLFGLVALIGTLVGLELPLLMRVLRDRLEFKDLVSRVLAFDYIGALLASILFPLVLVPRLGLVRTSLAFGLVNAGVGLWATWTFRPLIRGDVRWLRMRGIVAVVLLAAGAVYAQHISSWVEDDLFADPIVYSKTSAYQRIVVTQGRAGFQLYLNGNLQFSSVDEYRYHEALVHPALALAGGPKRVLVLGGGDGLAVREILRWPGVREIVLVDLDPDMTKLSSRFPPLATLNAAAFDSPKLTVINDDAMVWLELGRDTFDAAIVDFPDPNSFSLGKLYTRRFYGLLRSRLAPDATVAVQAGSPLFARTSFWCVIRTLESAGFSVRPYQVSVPSFGVWGFALARRTPFDVPACPVVGLRFLDTPALQAMFVLPPDVGPVDVEINRLDNQVLVRYYEDEWRRFEQ